MYPFPVVYCPPGVPRPAWIPESAGAFATHPAKAPDCPDLPPDQLAAWLVGRSWGLCHGAPLDHARGAWRRSPAGWWVNVDGHQPQHLARIEPHPSVALWRSVPGHHPGHVWRVPVLLVDENAGAPPLPDGKPAPRLWISALDRVLGPDGWDAPAELAPVQQLMCAVVEGIPLGATPAERDTAMMDLAFRLLAIGHHVDRDLLAALGWLRESMVPAIVRAALDRDAPLAPAAAEPEAAPSALPGEMPRA